jgi:hypothetical protein
MPSLSASRFWHKYTAQIHTATCPCLTRDFCDISISTQIHTSTTRYLMQGLPAFPNDHKPCANKHMNMPSLSACLFWYKYTAQIHTATCPCLARDFCDISISTQIHTSTTRYLVQGLPAFPRAHKNHVLTNTWTCPHLARHVSDINILLKYTQQLVLAWRVTFVI